MARYSPTVRLLARGAADYLARGPINNQRRIVGVLVEVKHSQNRPARQHVEGLRIANFDEAKHGRRIVQAVINVVPLSEAEMTRNGGRTPNPQRSLKTPAGSTPVPQEVVPAEPVRIPGLPLMAS